MVAMAISSSQLSANCTQQPSLSRNRRQFISYSASSLSFLSLTLNSYAQTSNNNNNSILTSGIANTKSWERFYGDGFSIRVPPHFQDLTEPEDYNAGLSLYGDKVKPKTFAARFASPDGFEELSVVIRPSNQLKITFLEAKDVTDFGSLKEAAKIFIPGGATIFSGRTIKIKEEDSFRNYYFYEFSKYDQHVALVAAAISGKRDKVLLVPNNLRVHHLYGARTIIGIRHKISGSITAQEAFIAAATAPQSKWDEDGVKLRSAAVSLTVL